MRSRAKSHGISVLPAALFTLLLFGGSIAQAVQTAYCEETYIGDCLNVQHCWFYEDSRLIGQGVVHYHCPV